MDREKFVRIIREHSPAPRPLVPPPLPPEWEALLFPPGPRTAASINSTAAGIHIPAAADGRRGGGIDAGGEKIRAVLFDVYGTLFCSAAGDIGGAAGSATGVEDRGRLEAAIREFAPGVSAGEVTDYFRRRVLEIHRERAGQTRYPEVRVEDIWAGFLERFPPKGGEGEGARRERAREFALRYELALNPVFPLPGTAGAIAALRESGVLLGLVSNAQFFTPLLFDAFLGASPEELGFDPALVVYSHEMGEAKPSPALFGRAAAELARRGVESGTCLYAGNDMRNDILGAAAAGWKTVLFAGDPLSLRLRRGDPSVGDLKPWRVVRDLRYLVTLLS